MARRAVFPDAPRPLILAHRGFSRLYPENTMKAFEAAYDAGAHAIELDVQVCSTGEVVVFHDYTTERVTGSPGRVDETGWRRLSELRVHETEAIPLLREVFDRFGDRLCYDIEIKHKVHGPSGIEEALVSMISSRGLERRCLVSSFNPYAVKEIRRISETIPVAIIYSHDSEVPRILRSGFGRYMCQADALKPDHAQYHGMHARIARMQSREVFVWTVDDAQVMKECVARGAAGVITNDPALAGGALYNRPPQDGQSPSD